MDVGDLSNAAGSLESGGAAAAVFGSGSSARGLIIDKAPHIIPNNTLGNSQAGGVAGWWTSPTSQTIVGANTTGDVMNQLCRVCGEPAAGFHFGAFTCEGCKSFFGRTYNNIGSISECKNGGVCVINKKNRTACKACRLRKCLMVGMSKSGSRYGRRSNWFKIHCLLQEQSHQARLKDPTKSASFDKVLDTANNNNTSNSPAIAGVSPGRLLSDEQRDQSPRSSIHQPELLTPEAIRFPIWRTPAFFHPSLSHMQFLGAPFFPFQQRFMVPYVNQVEPQISVNISSSSSDSVSSRSSPVSPKEAEEEENRNENDKNNQFFKCLGPEQDEPMDLSKKSQAVREYNSTDDNHQNTDKSGEIQSDNESVINETETGPPLDLTWKT